MGAHHILFKTMLRQEAPLYVVQVPFFVYFLAVTFPFGAQPLFLFVVGGLAAVALGAGVFARHQLTAPLRRWVAGGADAVDEAEVVHRANQLPIFDAWSVTARYTFAGVAGGLIAMRLFDASFSEAMLMALFATANGGLAGTVFFFTAEYDADQFLSTLERPALGSEWRLPLSVKIPTFVLVIVGYLFAIAYLIAMLMQSGLLNVDQLGPSLAPLGLSSLVYIFVGVFFFRASLTWKLANLRERIAEISAGDGDLSKCVPMGMSDEVTEIALELNSFISKLRGMMVQVVQTAEAVDAAAREFSRAADGLADDTAGMNEQSVEAAAAVEQLSSGLSTIATSVGDVSSNVSSVAMTTQGVSSSIAEVAGASETMSVDMSSVSAAVEEMSASLNEVAQAAARASDAVRSGTEKAKRASEQMERLGESAEEVGQVVALIEAIADKTNLLALNATIEAASAGAAGRGFAVVANEVKELAQQTTGATEQIAKQIGQIRGDARAAREMIKDVTEQIAAVDVGSASIAAAVEEQTATVTEIAGNISRTAGAANSISANVRGISEEVLHIASRSTEMSSGAENISHSSVDAAAGATQVSSQLGEMTRLVEHATERAHGVRQRATDLAKMSEGLSGLVSHFKTA